MPIRLLREGILSSPRVIQLTWPAEVFYRRLMSVVDDFGRYHATPMLLRAGCYPLQLDKVSDTDIGRWLEEARNAGLIRVFESGGMEYLELLDFRQQLRAKKSKFPTPLADAKQLPSTCLADASQLLTKTDSDSDAKTGPRKRRRSPETPLSADFKLSERVLKWGNERGYSPAILRDHYEHFILAASAKGYTYANWDSALIKAITKDWAGIGKGRSSPGERRLAT